MNTLLNVVQDPPTLRQFRPRSATQVVTFWRNASFARIVPFIEKVLFYTVGALIIVEAVFLTKIRSADQNSLALGAHIEDLRKDLQIITQRESEFAGNKSHTDHSLIGACDSASSLTGHKNSFDKTKATVFHNWEGNTHLTKDQCDILFPDLYFEIERAFAFWNKRGGITEELLQKAQDDGNARVAIIDGHMHVKWYGGFLINSRAMAVLNSINEAVVGTLERIPNVEFVINTADTSHQSTPCWALSRANEMEEPILMPDFAFWSWPEPGVGSFWELQDEARAKEDGLTWDTKIPKLFWKGALLNDERHRLISKYSSFSWSAMSGIDWGAGGDRGIVTPADHCDYQFLANLEGHAYSGRVENIAQCRSVLVMPKMKFAQHYTHLFNGDPSSPSRNAVILNDDEVNNLDPIMKRLMSQPDYSEKLANTSYEFFHFWLSRPSINCYWRRLFHMWASLQRYEPGFSPGDPSWQSFSLMRTLHWDTNWDPFK